MSDKVLLFIMNAAVVAILVAYGLFLKSGHLEFGLGVLSGMCLFASWFRLKKGYWP